MGTEVEAFLGSTEAVRCWKDQLTSVVIFSLTPDLGLVPATGALLSELRQRFQAPDDTDGEVAERWGREASKGCTIAYFTAFEFGDEGGESAVIWTGQQVVRRVATVNGALELLGAKPASVGIDRYRKTHLWAAAAVLQQLENRGGLGGVIEGLKHPSEYVRELAACGLRRYGPEAQAANPMLVEMAKNDPGYGARLSATMALEAIGSTAVPALKALLAPGELQDRWGAIFALGRIGPAGSSAVPDLIRILKTEKDSNQRRAAAETLGKIGEAAASAIPALIDAMRCEDRFVRYHSAVALGMMGPSASQAIPALKQALQDSYREVHWVAVVSLGKVGPFPMAEVLAALKTNSSWVVRSDAAKTLGKLGKDAQAAIPALIDALGDKDHSVRSRAAEALGLLGAAAKEAVPALRKAMEDRYVKRAAIKSIEQIQSAPA